MLTNAKNLINFRYVEMVKKGIQNLHWKNKFPGLLQLSHSRGKRWDLGQKSSFAKKKDFKLYLKEEKTKNKTFDP